MARIIYPTCRRMNHSAAIYSEKRAIQTQCQNQELQWLHRRIEEDCSKIQSGEKEGQS